MMTRGLWISSGFAATISSLKVTQPQQTGINQSKTHESRLLWNLPLNDSQCYPQLTHLFLLNCTAVKPAVKTCRSMNPSAVRNSLTYFLLNCTAVKPAVKPASQWIPMLSATHSPIFVELYCSETCCENLPVNESQRCPQLTHLFLLNCTAKPDMGCMALLVNVSSINICPLLRANVPLISKPLPFAAGSHTCNNNSGHFYRAVSQVATPAIITQALISMAPYLR